MDPINPIPTKRENLQPFGGTAVQDRPGEPSLIDSAKNKASDLLDQAKERAAETVDSVKGTCSRLGEQLEEGGEYLRDQATAGGEELTNLIRRNPVPALLLSFSVGFFLCRWMKD